MLGLGMLSPTFAVMVIGDDVQPRHAHDHAGHAVHRHVPVRSKSTAQDWSVSAFSLAGSVVAFVLSFWASIICTCPIRRVYHGTVFYVFAAFAMGLMKKGKQEVRRSSLFSESAMRLLRAGRSQRREGLRFL
jgi:hypothetical protein